MSIPEKITAATPAVGEPYTSACWFIPSLAGDKKQAKRMVRGVFKYTSRDMGLDFSPVKFQTYDANDRRIAVKIPEEYEGKSAKLLVGEAKINHIHKVVTKPDAGESFLADLSFHDLQLLRSITRDVAVEHGKNLTDKECDAIIAERGPDLIQKVLRAEINNK